MIYVAVAVKDTAAGLFHPPMFVRHQGQALRWFMDEVNRADQQNPLAMHPKDFELWRLGTFDDITGSFAAIDASVIAIGVDVRNTIER